jgi:hypothetical protein
MRFLDMVKENTVIVPSTERMASVLSKDSHLFKIIPEPIYYNSASKYNTMQFDWRNLKIHISYCDKKRAKLYIRKIQICNIQLKPSYYLYINYCLECS